MDFPTYESQMREAWLWLGVFLFGMTMLVYGLVVRK